MKHRRLVARHALRVEIDGRNGPGDLVIGAAAVSDLLSGRRAEINFVQTPTPDRVIIGFSGEAWVSRSGRAATLRIEGVIYSSPIAQVRQVVAGFQSLSGFPMSCNELRRRIRGWQRTVFKP